MFGNMCVYYKSVYFIVNLCLKKNGFHIIIVLNMMLFIHLLK